MFFEVRGRIFFMSDNNQDTLVDFHFTVFTKVLMKELAQRLMSIKSSTVRVSFKILLLMCLAILEKKL